MTGIVKKLLGIGINRVAAQGSRTSRVADPSGMQAEIDRLRAENERLQGMIAFVDAADEAENNDLRAEIRRLRAELEAGKARVRRALEHYDARSELYTSGDELAAGMASILRAEKAGR